MSANMTWAFNAASRFVEQERMRSEKWARAAQRHQTLLTQVPVLWETTRQALQAQIRTFNERVGREVLVASADGDQRVAVLARTETGTRSIIVEFDPKGYWITCSACAANSPTDFEQRIQLLVNEQARAAMALPSGEECSAEEAAGYMLNGLMGWHQPTT